MNVTQTQAEIVETQIKVEEHQRIIGIIPNYFVTYNPDAAPLNSESTRSERVFRSTRRSTSF